MYVAPILLDFLARGHHRNHGGLHAETHALERLAIERVGHCDDELPFDARLFDELVRRGFAQRRKQLRKQLPDGPDWEKVTASLGLSTTVRGEELDLGKWKQLTRAYDPHPLKDMPQRDGEIFEVVDELDNPTGTATRSEVHSRGLLHRAVHVFVLNRNGDLYLQKRSLHKDMNPGVWDSSVSGHLDAGESYADAAVRELGEEMGIQGVAAGDLEHVATIPPSEQTGWEHIRLFLTKHNGPVSFPAAEIDSAMPFPEEEIAAWIAASPGDFSPAFLAMFAAWRENRG